MDINNYLFEEEAYHGERTSLKFRWILIVMVLAFILITFLRGDKSEALLSFIPAGVFFVYNIFLAFLIGKGKNLYFLRYFSVSIDIIALSFHIYINSRIFSPIAVSSTASIFIYPILMFLSVLRYDKTLIIFATVLTLVMFNLNYILSYQTIDKLLMEKVISSDPMGQVYKSGYLLILGLFFLKIPDLVSRHIQRQKEILEEKNEYVVDLLLEKREKKALKNNLSELNTLHQELQQKTIEIENQNRKLSELVQTKDRLISFISHDLKNSFSTMSSIIETTRDSMAGLDREELSVAMDILHKHSLTNHVLFENLLQWAKLQHGQLSINKEKIKLSDFCHHLIQNHEQSLNLKGLSLEVDIAGDVVVLADPIILTSVCNNIVGNAIKFSFRGGKIEIGARIENKYVLVDVKDYGMGISKKALSGIFSIESCKSTIGTEGEKGSGFGLILCKELIEKNGGIIRIESEVGKGTTIILQFINANFEA
jgi:signal transduction histidine kinase